MLRGLLSRISQVLGFSATHATNVASPEGHSFGSGEVLEEDYQVHKYRNLKSYNSN